VRARIMASVVVAAGVLLGTSGCNLFAPQATTMQYEAGDGVSGSVGSLDIRNAILLTDDGENANLLVTVVNSTGDDIELLVQYEGVEEKVDKTVDVEANSSTTFGGTDAPSLAFDSLNAAKGSLFPVFFQYGDNTGVELLVPVLDGSLSQYSEFVPTEKPTPTATPSPASTEEPTSEPTPTPEATVAP